MQTNKTQKAGIYLSLLFFLFLHACNLPSETEPELSMESQAGTLAAQTVEANKQQRPTKTRVPRSTPTQVRPSKTPTPATTETETPTQAPSVPTAPSLQNYNFFCSWNGSGVDLTITIEWSDKSNDEEGFTVLRNGEEIAKLPPNTSSYSDAYAVSTGQTTNYAVQAYNNSGISEQITLSATCE